VNASKATLEHEYERLVQDRKVCKECKCGAVRNPSETNYDCNQLNAWSQWQNSLSAKILLVGMDWGTVRHFIENKGKDPADATNKNLVILFRSIGHEIDCPNGETYGEPDAELFFTNVVLCLREANKMQGNMCQIIANACARKFTRRLIDIIRPEAVIALGQTVSNAIADCCYDDGYSVKLPGRWREAVEDEGYRHGFRLNRDTVMFPVYHCGTQGEKRNRHIDKQKRDWKKIREYLHIEYNGERSVR
jgi:hypothetical protein